MIHTDMEVAIGTPESEINESQVELCNNIAKDIRYLLDALIDIRTELPEGEIIDLTKLYNYVLDNHVPAGKQVFIEAIKTIHIYSGAIHSTDDPLVQIIMKDLIDTNISESKYLKIEVQKVLSNYQNRFMGRFILDIINTKYNSVNQGDVISIPDNTILNGTVQSIFKGSIAQKISIQFNPYAKILELTGISVDLLSSYPEI